MTAHENSRVLDRLIKLFALAENNPSANEAQAALLLAQKIMAENAISESEVRARGEVNEARDEIGEEYAWQDEGRERRDTFVGRLAVVVARYFRVRTWSDAGGRISFGGYGNDRKVACLVFRFARSAMVQGAADYMTAWKCVNETDARRSRLERQSWLGGFIAGLNAGFDRALENNPTWLACTQLPTEVSVWVDEQHPNLRATHSQAQLRAGTGRTHGERAGQEFATQHGGGKARATQALRATNT